MFRKIFLFRAIAAIVAQSTDCGRLKSVYTGAQCCGAPETTIVSDASTVLFSEREYGWTLDNEAMTGDTTDCPSTAMDVIAYQTMGRLATATEKSYLADRTSMPYDRLAATAFEDPLFRSKSMDMSDATGTTVACVGCTSGLGFAASIMWAMRGAEVYLCARTDTVYESNKAAAMASLDDFSAEQSRIKHLVDSGVPVEDVEQLYMPMYSGFHGVAASVFDHIHASLCDSRVASSMEAFFEHIRTDSVNELRVVHFNPGLWAGRGAPYGSTVYGGFSGNVSGSPVVYPPIRNTETTHVPIDEVVAQTPNRSISLLYENMAYTEDEGFLITFGAWVKTYEAIEGWSVMGTRWTITSSVAGTAPKQVATFPAYFRHYASVKASSVSRVVQWASDGVNITAILPTGVPTTLNFPILPPFAGISTKCWWGMNRLPTKLPNGKYKFLCASYEYSMWFDNNFAFAGVMALPTLVAAATFMEAVRADVPSGALLQNPFKVGLPFSDANPIYTSELRQSNVWSKLTTCGLKSRSQLLSQESMYTAVNAIGSHLLLTPTIHDLIET